MSNINMIKCNQIGICGGCIDRDKTYEEHVLDKEKKVKEILFNAIDSMDIDINKNLIEFESIIHSPMIYEYRNKMEFSFGDSVKNGPLTLGMHQRKSFYNIVSADNCNLISEDMRDILKLTVDFFSNQNISYYHKKTHIGYLRYLVLRKSFYENNILINLVTTSQIDKDLEKQLLSNYIDKIYESIGKDSVAGILHTINDGLSDAVKVDKLELLSGRDYLIEKICGLKFIISPFSFFQTNSLCAEKLYEKSKSYLMFDKGNTDFNIYDLYCGTGTISQIVSDKANRVIGIEILDEAISAAKENARINNINNVDFYAMDVNDYVLEFKNLESNKNDIIILDPPRDGINKNALVKILEFGVDRILYISCKITSLARDMEYLYSYGYNLVKVCPVDMFPWTKNVETIALFVKST